MFLHSSAILSKSEKIDALDKMVCLWGGKKEIEKVEKKEMVSLLGWGEIGPIHIYYFDTLSLIPSLFT